LVTKEVSRHLVKKRLVDRHLVDRRPSKKPNDGHYYTALQTKYCVFKMSVGKMFFDQMSRVTNTKLRSLVHT